MAGLSGAKQTYVTQVLGGIDLKEFRVQNLYNNKKMAQ